MATVETLVGDVPRAAADGPGQRVLLVVLDCAEKSLVERWMAEGHMPHLKSLRERGSMGDMGSTADVMVSSPWPVTMTSRWPVETGFVCWMQWRPETMDEQRCDPSWLPWTPFYRRLGPAGKRVIAIDVPMAYEPVPFDGMEIVSWGSYDKLGEVASYPEDLYRRLARAYHKLPIGPELGELQGIKAQLKLKDSLIRGTEKVGDACRDLMRDERWDLFIAAFGATHRAGHNFWDYGSFRERPEDVPPALLAEFDRAILDVYKAADRQLGKLLSVKPDDAAVVVMATHGMGPSTSRYDLMHQLLDPVLHNRRVEPGPPAKKGLLKRLRGSIPVSWRSRVKRALPNAVQDQLTKFWVGKGQRDWSQVRAFSPVGDLEGYVRVNLKGREREGVVEPAEMEPLLQEIEAGLRSWKDEATGEPVVKRILRGAELWPEVPASERKPYVPDLIVQWSDQPAVQMRVMVSERYGKVLWPIADKVPDGRSGHHNPRGWVLAVAEGVPAGATAEPAHGIDLAPTVMHLLGLEPFPEMRGRVMPAVAQASTAVSR